ncbi:MAG: gliding motility-associated C-terminal domain-containing protein [Algibacter sp.]|uniref:gliding motility-associated C-terminal domain-containing protein n=1 Tax=Algibacter sp. TaxID=1872428 RepID=UPI002609CDEA|nr:gliding motility-associated C-terminal domain-containing protein [Algibacter sp.]MDG1730542.1 gliding motility-associated C-terminal domain-containing protein [Algibacter sp.]MDG2177573.1 gliding motility-associated C-terminal domain-containing protein [Algibacter sp.]
MKTKPTRKNALLDAFFYLLLFGLSYSGFSQCPTVTNPTPPPICIASGFTFSDMNTFATYGASGIVWYDASSGGSFFNPDQLVSEGVYYADNNTGTCVTRASVTIDFLVNPTGRTLDGIYCSNENATIQTYIDEVLQPNAPVSGSVEVYTDINLTTLANSANPITNVPNFYIVFVDSGGCKSQVEIGSTAVFNAPADPIPATPQVFCLDNNPTIGDLDPGTTATNFSWYANVDGSGEPILPALSMLTPLVDGNSYYIRINDVFCESNAIEVLVNIDDPVEAGTPAPEEYCEDDLASSTPLDLFGQLTGEDAGGTWADDNATGALTGGNIDLTLLPIGISTFTYTVLSNNTCPDSSSTVSITVYETLTSGNQSVANPASFCEASLPSAFDLFSLIENQDPGGQWTGGNSTIDLIGFSAGTYNFTYTQNALPNPCPEETTTVEIIILQDPHAGNALNDVFCENDLVSNSPYDLFDALDSTQDNNSGTWTDSSNNKISNTLDITTLTVDGSPYTYNYTIDNGTCSDTEAITIILEDAPESGTPVATFPDFCEDSAPASYNLFDLIEGEDQTGTWYSGTDNTGAIASNPTDLSGLTPGTYDFTFDVDDIGSCDDELVTVQITINPLPLTGTPTSETYCENDLAANSPLDLFGQLTGEDSGGTWTDDDATGALSGSDLNLTALTIGTFNFTYTLTDSNDCTNSSSVTITVREAPESGTANTPIEFCLADITAGQTYNLFDLLTDEDQTGTWIDDDTTGALTANVLTLDGLLPASYNFTFDVDAIGSCDDVNVTVSIIINDTPAPNAVTPQEFCDIATVANLVATGTTIQWYDAITGGNPLTDTTALTDGQIYYASQTDATTGCESSVRTAVTPTIYQSPIAGDPNATPIVACNDNNNIDLFAGLDGTEDAGGTWQNDNAVGTLVGNIFDASGVSAGTYNFTYLVTASAPCVDDSETITITIEAPLNAGSNIDPTLDICSNEGTIDLFTLLGGADTGGVWSPEMASTTGVFDPLVDLDGTYTYTLTNSCGTFTNQVVVTVTLAPNAGVDNILAICVGDDPIDLFALLGSGAQSGGSWAPELISTTGVFNPEVDPSGTYIYTVTALAPCPPDSTAEIVVTVNDSPPVIVLDSDPEFCLANNPTVANLSISVRPSGALNWYEDLALTIPLLTTDALVDGEDYYATQTNSTGCESSIPVQINVTINDSSTPTLEDPTIEYCVNDNPTIQMLSDNIIEYDDNQDNLRWYDSLTGGIAFSDDTLLTNITYYVALVDPLTGCESSVRLEVIPDLTACGKLTIPDGFSPNGDGKNDTFDVDNLSILFPNFVMEIYNRNGNMVYKGNANSPRFDGTSNQGRIVSKGDLPVGVYFYIFNFNDGENTPEQGRLYLSR